jgi:hypothetical protein
VRGRDLLAIAELGSEELHTILNTALSLKRDGGGARLLAGKSVPGRLESFLEGTEPTAAAPAPGSVDPNDFLLHDKARRQP